jgi:hypothetical protein
MSEGKNAKFMADPVAFMRTYSVMAPDSVGHNIGDEGGTLPTTAMMGKDYVYSDMQVGQKVAYLNFAKKARKGPANLTFIHKSEGTMVLDATYAQRPHKVKSYFLPWTAGGGIIRLEIPDKATIAAGTLDSDYFFTATITGCSIFIKGTQRNPIIYHAGGPTNAPANPAGAATFWRNLITTCSAGDGALAAEINKMHYVTDPAAGGATTANAQTFQGWLTANTGQDLRIQSVEPWGCVMGVRDAAGNWRFYLQENATILFYEMKKKNVFSNTRVQGQLRASGRPMIFREIFPNGAAHHVFMPSLPRRLT